MENVFGSTRLIPLNGPSQNRVLSHRGTRTKLSGNPTTQALGEIQGKFAKQLVQLRVLGLGLLQDGNVGVGVFPRRERTGGSAFEF